MFDLSGRVAVVTGGNGGIGLGIAKGLAQAGARIAVWARNEEKNAAAIEELGAISPEPFSLVCDVSSEEATRAAVEETVGRAGRIDIAVANAGFGMAKNFMKTSLDDWRKVTSVDLDGAFVTFRETARHMIERGGGGKLIGISSIGEIYGMASQGAYSASKGALGALVRTLAVELGRHDIQVNCVQPGWIHTDATAPIKEYEKLYKMVSHRTPAKRWGEPEELAGACVYLASDEARFHTGDTLRVDGGYSVF